MIQIKFVLLNFDFIMFLRFILPVFQTSDSNHNCLKRKMIWIISTLIWIKILIIRLNLHLETLDLNQCFCYWINLHCILDFEFALFNSNHTISHSNHSLFFTYIYLPPLTSQTIKSNYKITIKSFLSLFLQTLHIKHFFKEHL